MKLKKININQIAQNQVEKEWFQVFDDFSEQFFPADETKILNNLRKLKSENKGQVNGNNQSYGNSQFTMQNDNSLTMYMHHRLICILNSFYGNLFPSSKKMLNSLSVDLVKKYVKTSPVLAKERDEYEQRIVKAYILIHKNDDYDFKYNQAEIAEERADIFYDQKFRENVVKAMSSLNISMKNIETALEMNQKLWLPETRRQTFDNRKPGNIIGKDRKLMYAKQPVMINLLEEMDFKLFQKWNKLSDYGYYKTHGKTIDRLGIKHPAKRMSVQQKNELAQEVFSLGFQYNDQLMKCRNVLANLNTEREQNK